MKPVLTYLDRWFARFGPAPLVAASLLMVAFIGVIRWVSGPEVAFSAFFLVPIIISTWCAGRWIGILISVISIMIWLAADMMVLSEFSNPAIPFINEILRSVVFLFVVLLIADLKASLAEQAEIARRDPLTGIANRSAFIESAEMEVKKAKRFNHSVSILYIDIDHFKAVNDRFGHHSGDMLLKTVGRSITDNIRAIDLAGRLGGDEFALLLPNTDTKGLGTIAHKLVRILRREMQLRGWPATFSVGAATFREVEIDIHGMINKADILMYIAKERGRDRVVQQTFSGDDRVFNGERGCDRGCIAGMQPGVGIVGSRLHKRQ
jgi:diguanylate cyclase (GGDEF)-like protein